MGGGAYQYDSLENMYTDISNRHNGDIGVVYINSHAGITADTEFQVATFLETVTLDEALSGYIELSFQAVDASQTFNCWGQLTSSRFSMRCFTNDGEIRIEYRSQNGIIYTRTTFMKNSQTISGDEMDFGTLIKFGSPWGGSNFNPVIGKFIATGTTTFNGLFQHNGTNFIILPNTGLNANLESVFNTTFFGNAGIGSGTLGQTTNLNIQQLKDRVNLYSSLSNLTFNESVNSAYSLFEGSTLNNIPALNLSAVQNAISMFNSCTNLIKISNINASNVKTMTVMFQNCSNLVDVENFIVNSAETTSYMFSNCVNLVNIPILNLHSDRNIYNMFMNCNNLSENSYHNIANSLPLASQLPERLVYTAYLNVKNFSNNDRDILFNKGYLDCDRNTSGWSTQYNINNGSGWKLYNRGDEYDRYGYNLRVALQENAANATNLTIKSEGTDNGILLSLNPHGWYVGIFSTMNKVVSLNIEELNISNISNFSYAFSNCSNLTSIKLNYNTNMANNTTGMFSNCIRLTTIPNFNTSNVTNMYYMFNGCTNLTTIPNFNTTSVTDMHTMFHSCINLKNVPNFDTSNVINMSIMFQNCYNLVNIPNWNTSNVADMSRMFINCNNLANVPNFDTSNVTSMGSMFENCANLKNISQYNTSNVTNMANMLRGCSNLTTVPNFDTSNVTNMASILRGCSKLTTVPNFNTSKVVSMGGAFFHCNNLTSIPNFNTSSVTNMENMFEDCWKLVTVPQLNTSNVNILHQTFRNCNNLSSASIQNIINMCLNSNVSNSDYMNLHNNYGSSPFAYSNIDNSKYQNRWAELTAAGWKY